jgi:hypothetical protein
MIEEWQWSLMTLGVFLLILAVWWRLRPPAKKRSGWSYLAVVLIIIGAYLFPMGAIDVYKLTEEYLGLAYLENYVLWLVITASCILVGLGVLRWRKK